MKSRPGKERRAGAAEAKAEDLEAAEYCCARKPKAGEILMPEGCGVTTGMHYP
jgi:hypothetical protein